ncbi:alpha-1,2-mannosyltransferase ALG9-like [Watersipora subatra]|uniref:alpha-1,2-mannosyltransferase ALG9-like n=1 Tax=Watersipora subatra TaxID=2589382 RepID=UPI00355BA6DB
MPDTRRRSRTAEPRIREIPINSSVSTVPWQGPICRGSVWTPKVDTAFKLLLSFRLVSAIWSNISDCDETYNYWEPAHFMLYGNGFQTWEYSPQYAIRSYAYIALHVIPIKVIRLFTAPERILTFYFIRCVLAMVCASCETYFYRGVIKHYDASVARLTLSFMLLSTGMYISAAAFLPSSFSMYMTLLSMGAWYSGHLPVAIISTAISAIIGWPFAAVLGAPLAIDIVYRKKKPQLFVVWVIISLCLVLAPTVYYDSLMYGKRVIASLNIIMYNVMTSHGPDLYGTEPWTFYFINGFLNFNFVFLLALPAIVLLYATQKYTGLKFPGIPHYIALAPMYLWIVIFFSQAHKEERFLFPIYPLICLSAALSLDSLQRLFSSLVGYAKHYTDFLWYIPVGIVCVSGLLSISRNLALYHGYHAPIDIYTALNNISSYRSIHRLRSDASVSVCMGKEWYRYPSSFFLASERWKLLFLKSEFRGQLPGRYEKGEDAMRVIPRNMNDMNKEEPSRYMDDIHCHYLIDLDTGKSTEREPDYSKNPDKYQPILSLPFLDNERSHKLFRAFYVPFLSDGRCTYRNYTLYQVRRPPKVKPDKV